MFAVPSFFGYNTTFVSTPVATAATGVGETSFTANWNAFAGASYYLLDVSTSSTFSSFVGSYQNFVVLTTSQLVSGLTASTTYYYRLRAATGVDADAAAFFSRVYTAGGALSYTEVSATETLVADMKSAGIWSGMKAIYPMVGASAAACAQNLKSSSFTGTFSSGWTFASTGATPNGTNAYMDTGLNISTTLSQNSTHLSYYSRTNTTDGSVRVDIGLLSGAVPFLYLSARLGAGYGPLCNINNTSINLLSQLANSLGFYIGSRVNSSQRKIYANNTLIDTWSQASETMINDVVVIGRNYGQTEYTDRQTAFASIGDGLTDTQASNFYTAVQAFQTTLARQIAP